MPEASLRSRADTDIDREVGEIVGALGEAGGPLARRRAGRPHELAVLGSRALLDRAGDRDGAGEVRRVGRGRYEARIRSP